jgi:hypothetical protein
MGCSPGVAAAHPIQYSNSFEKIVSNRYFYCLLTKYVIFG